jgi:hypothetical protein
MYVMQIIKVAIETEILHSVILIYAKVTLIFYLSCCIQCSSLFMPFVIYGFGFHCRYMEKNMKTIFGKGNTSLLQYFHKGLL